MSQYAPKFFPGQTITLVADDDIAGGQALVVSGDGTVAPSSDESVAFIGVAVSDVASGGPVAIYTVGVHRLTASGAITAGDPVKTDTDGKVAAATDATTIDGAEDEISEGDTAQGVVIGVALTTAAQDGDEVLVKIK